MKMIPLEFPEFGFIRRVCPRGTSADSGVRGTGQTDLSTRRKGRALGQIRLSLMGTL
jgi:hypothetical protein